MNDMDASDGRKCVCNDKLLTYMGIHQVVVGTAVNQDNLQIT